jgi:hypothetical protein
MANFDAGNVRGIDFTTFDVTTLAAGDPTDSETTVYRLTDKGNANTFIEYIGFGFTYDNLSGLLTGGTITDIAVVENNKSVYEIDLGGAGLSATDLNNFVAGKDSTGFLAEVFGGSDNLDGSTFADHLQGFAGRAAAAPTLSRAVLTTTRSTAALATTARTAAPAATSTRAARAMTPISSAPSTRPSPRTPAKASIPSRIRGTNTT